MINILKKGACVVFIYCIAIVCTLIMANRVEKLNANLENTKEVNDVIFLK